MAIIDCPGCGAKISDRAPACGACGLTKADREQGRTIPPKPPPNPKPAPPQRDPIATGRKSVLDRLRHRRADANPNRPERLDCSLCQTSRSMVSDEIPRFHEGVIQVTGFLLAVPGALGIAAGILAAIAVLIGVGLLLVGKIDDPAVVTHGAILAATIVASGFVSGTLGWLLLSRRRVWRCTRCGYVLERA